MSLECPNCRNPVSLFRSMRTSIGGRFRCQVCDSVLGIDGRRRFLALIPNLLIFAALIALSQRIGFDGPWIFLCFPLTAIVVGSLFEHVVLIAPGDYHCLTCGYDLRGQVENRCSECGAPLHIADRYRAGRGKPLDARTLDPVARGIVIALIVVLILWILLVVAEFIPKL